MIDDEKERMWQAQQQIIKARRSGRTMEGVSERRAKAKQAVRCRCPCGFFLELFCASSQGQASGALPLPLPLRVVSFGTLFLASRTAAQGAFHQQGGQREPYGTEPDTRRRAARNALARGEPCGHPAVLCCADGRQGDQAAGGA